MPRSLALSRVWKANLHCGSLLRDPSRTPASRTSATGKLRPHLLLPQPHIDGPRAWQYFVDLQMEPLCEFPELSPRSGVFPTSSRNALQALDPEKRHQAPHWLRLPSLDSLRVRQQNNRLLTAHKITAHGGHTPSDSHIPHPFPDAQVCSPITMLTRILVPLCDNATPSTAGSAR